MDTMDTTYRLQSGLKNVGTFATLEQAMLAARPWLKSPDAYVTIHPTGQSADGNAVCREPYTVTSRIGR